MVADTPGELGLPFERCDAGAEAIPAFGALQRRDVRRLRFRRRRP
jgi:hypothetical protein